jgi:Uri superfamily endonuclease
MNNHAAVHGTYLLLLECKQATDLVVGRLGNMKTEPGYYVYVGSAFGPGGIQARVNHHRQLARRPHWHVDYLRSAAQLIEAWCVHGVRCEHEWAQALLQLEAAAVPLAGFGSSDCDCRSHAFYLRHKPARRALEGVLKSQLNPVPVPGRARD